MKQILITLGTGVFSFIAGALMFSTEAEVIEVPGKSSVHAIEVIREIEVPVLPGTTYTRNEHIHLAATMWGEARGDGVRGMRAVGHVILNRVNSSNDRRYGSTLSEVMFRDRQFSVWNIDDPNRPLMLSLVGGWQPGGRDGEMWLIAKAIAAEILSGRSTDPTDGALYYHTQDVDPEWNDYAEGEMILASHVFYQDATR